MARINVEQEWWNDPRRGLLARLLGSEELADGAMLKAWYLAQYYWVHENRTLIPAEMWECFKYASEIISAKLAEVRDGGIYVRGTDTFGERAKENYDKNTQNQSDKGKRRAKTAQRGEDGRFVGQPPAPAQPGSSRTPAGLQPQPAASSLSYSYSNSISEDKRTNTKSPALVRGEMPTQSAQVPKAGGVCVAEERKQHPGGMDREQQGQMHECTKVWLESVKAMTGIERGLYQGEDRTILDSIKRNGFELTRDALFGARHEPSTPTFDPRRRINMARVLGPKMIRTLADEGKRNRPKTRLVYTPEIEQTPKGNPETAREAIENLKGLVKP